MTVFLQIFRTYGARAMWPIEIIPQFRQKRAHFLGIGGETGNEAENWLFIGEFKDFEETSVWWQRHLRTAATFRKSEKGINRKERKDHKPLDRMDRIDRISDRFAPGPPGGRWKIATFEDDDEDEDDNDSPSCPGPKLSKNGCAMVLRA